MGATVGKVLALAVRTQRKGPMRELEQVRATADFGLDGDQPVKDFRGITLLSQPQWEGVQAELNADMPWHTRRANLLTDVPRLGEWIGRTIRIGSVVVEITGETRPCGLMDELQPGLQTALKPECRAGVHGHIRESGSIRVGDEIQLLTE